MPIYEYRCNACGAKLSRFTRTLGADVGGTCDHCGSVDLRRLVSRVAILRPPLDPGSLNKAEMLDGVDYSNPASMASFFRRMTDTFQDEPNEHMDEIIGRLDHGDPVEKALDLHVHDHSEGAHSHEGDAGSD